MNTYLIKVAEKTADQIRVIDAQSAQVIDRLIEELKTVEAERLGLQLELSWLKYPDEMGK